MTGQVHVDYGGWLSGPCLDETTAGLSLLRGEFPRWNLWRGESGTWWAAPPPGSALRFLLGADDPADLARQVAEVADWEGTRRWP